MAHDPAKSALARRRSDVPGDDSEAEALRLENALLKAEVERLRALADRDALVPVLNRRAFVRELQRAMAFCKRYGMPSAVLYLDLDGFKAVNDRFGHLAGDAALLRVGELLVENVRESDVVARLGGDEFAVLLHQADLEAARLKAQALSDCIEAEPFIVGGERVPLGGSFGVRVYDGQASAEEWLAEADAQMFVRKRTSR
jgi:diguanylate cyclase (GGDEF)-like protein